ncbi:MAG: MotA/TolQ/ExbB proton channel family protein [Candidatus Latescibacteria bacterium]|nr:MotA/TolQ/ExbB proton channel family protein [Candidatus Latescibacterota bacterium]
MKKRIRWLGIVLVTLPAIAAWAQQEAESTNFLVEYFNKGGMTMYPLVAFSLLSLTFMIERAVILFTVPTPAAAEQYLHEIEGELQSSGESEAIRRTSEGKGVLNYVFAALIKRYDTLVLERRQFEDMRRELLETCENSGMTYLGSNLPILSTIASVAPLLGLFGTISGMISAFDSLARAGAGDPQIVAKGISEALVTTATGLVIAIPTLIVYRVLATRADAVLGRIELFTHAFANTLLLQHEDNPDSL